MATKQSFSEALLGIMKEQGAKCAICDYVDKEDVEVALREGVQPIKVARALQIIKVIDPNISDKAAAERVKKHKKDHMASLPIMEGNE